MTTKRRCRGAWPARDSETNRNGPVTTRRVDIAGESVSDPAQIEAHDQAGRRPATTRGVVVARLHGRKPCLCGEPILAGQSIVKRWRQWIHETCYDELQAAKMDAAGLNPAQIEAIVRAHVRGGRWVPPAAAATLLELIDSYRHTAHEYQNESEITK
jgi:hypothetical protein